MTSFAKFTLEEFIEIYKGEPSLWKVKSKEYHDRNLRSEAYKKLLEKLRELEPLATKEDVVKKINNLRSNVRKAKMKYNDSIRSGVSADAVKKPTLWYFHLFDFLQDERCKRKSSSNLDNDDSLLEEGSEVSNPPLEFEEDSHSDVEMIEDNLNATPKNIVPSAQEVIESQRSKTQRKKAEDNLANEVLLSVRDHFKRPAAVEDRYDLLGKPVAIKLRGMEKNQSLLAEKVINNVLFEGETNCLTRDSFSKHSNSNPKFFLQQPFQNGSEYPPSTSSPASPSSPSQNSTHIMILDQSTLPSTEFLQMYESD